MSHIPKALQRRFELRNVEDVRFFQRGALELYRDGIQFSNGCEVLLQVLPEGIHFVLLRATEERQLVASRMPVWSESLAA